MPGIVVKGGVLHELDAAKIPDKKALHYPLRYTAEGEAIEPGDTFEYCSNDGRLEMATVLEVGDSTILYKKVNGHTGVSRPFGRLVRRGSDGKTYPGVTTYRSAFAGDVMLTFRPEQQEGVMKYAFKGYVIELDGNGNQVKILHEDIIFAKTVEQAKQVILINATTGGVVTPTTNFVVIASQLGQ